jgi:hypothetical protein
MHPLDGLSIRQHSISLSKDPDAASAREVIKEFFHFFDGQAAQEHLWYMLVLALKNDSEEVTAIHRGNLLFFYEYCCALFQASSFLREQHGAGRKKKKPPRRKRK